MSIDNRKLKVSYGRTFPIGSFASERIDLEYEFVMTENDSVTSLAHQSASQLKEIIESIHKKNNPHLYQEQTPIDYNQQIFAANAPIEIRNEEEKRSQQSGNQSQEQKIQNLISQSTSLPELKQWELLSKSNEKLKEAYEKRLLELSE
jgi:hypothetical protein